jgi:hypothetical protein
MRGCGCDLGLSSNQFHDFLIERMPSINGHQGYRPMESPCICGVQGDPASDGSQQSKDQLERLDENIGAVAIELTPDDLREIESAASKMTVQGARYPENLERLSYR